MITAIPASAPPDAVSLHSFDPDPDTAMPTSSISPATVSLVPSDSATAIPTSSVSPAAVVPVSSDSDTLYLLHQFFHAVVSLISCDSAIPASSISPVMLSSSAPAIITPARSSTASSSTCTSSDSRCISPIVNSLVSAGLVRRDLMDIWATPAADAA